MTIEECQKTTQTPEWLHEATKAAHGWGIGKEMSAEAYKAACEKVANYQIGDSAKEAQERLAKAAETIPDAQE